MIMIKNNFKSRIKNDNWFYPKSHWITFHHLIQCDLVILILLNNDFLFSGEKKNKITTAKHWNQNVISFSCCGFYSVFCIHYDRIRFKHTINRFDLWFDRQLLKYEKKTCGTFEGKKTEFLSFSGKQNSIRKKRINFKQIENILIVSTKFSSCDSFMIFCF